MPEQHKDYDISPAQVRWNRNSPISEQFDDIYFSQHSGLEESQYVFIKNNQLPERLSEFTGPRFTIGEIGFGSGLNFLTTWRCFQNAQLAHIEAPDLHFISFEKHPLKVEDLRRAHSAWPTLADLSQQLAEQYPLLTPGWHRLRLSRCTLDIWFGEAAIGLKQLEATFDALYLDGFAPSKNPDLWNVDLINALATKANGHTTFSTFTAAGNVRRALTAANFMVRKVRGFGNKRDMLVGQKIPSPREALTKPSTQSRTVSVIGAGVSGATIAWQLAERGWIVHLYETEAKPAQQASGNTKAVLYTKVTPHNTAQNDFYRLSYAYALRFWRAQQQLRACGVLQLLLDENAYEKSKAAVTANTWEHTTIQIVSPDMASRLSGQNIHHPGVWFPCGGWLRPQEACKKLIDHPSIVFHPKTTVLALTPTHESWMVKTNGSDSIYTNTVILANGRAAETLWPNDQPIAELRSVRGQTTTVPLADIHHPNCVVNHRGYCIPGEGELELGATFQPRECDLTIREADHINNIDYTINVLPHLREPIDLLATTRITGKAGIRCQSLDYLPLVGHVPDNHWRPDSRSTWPNLYLFTAMGSRGFTSAPLAADMLASVINGDPLPVQPSIRDALKPERFLLRKKQ